MKLLDLFCCEGGAAMGYHRAGFDVVGVDIEPQPNYPFEFWHQDAMLVLDTLADSGWSFDAIHASPPCQDHSTLSAAFAERKHGTGWMLAETIERLDATGLPYVVENVMGAKRQMPNAFTLCARSFGIQRMRRHRLFLTNFPIMAMPCACDGTQPLGIYGDLSKNDRKVRNSKDGGIRMRAGVQSARDLLDCQWMTAKGLTQAIPPVYTEFIGQQLMAHLSEAVA